MNPKIEKLIKLCWWDWDLETIKKHRQILTKAPEQEVLKKISTEYRENLL